uniref:Uncharacterized protein n=1 Tax=Nelumbo nucifera TaxID=4432 RepID=A0A822XGF1_NELNU|nr:TPA_asm: hypothetical protein HUJ06_020455 [Nelumbo nucifera]
MSRQPLARRPRPYRSRNGIVVLVVSGLGGPGYRVSAFLRSKMVSSFAFRLVWTILEDTTVLISVTLYKQTKRTAMMLAYMKILRKVTARYGFLDSLESSGPWTYAS